MRDEVKEREPKEKEEEAEEEMPSQGHFKQQ